MHLNELQNENFLLTRNYHSNECLVCVKRLTNTCYFSNCKIYHNFQSLTINYDYDYDNDDFYKIKQYNKNRSEADEIS